MTGTRTTALLCLASAAVGLVAPSCCRCPERKPWAEGIVANQSVTIPVPLPKTDDLLALMDQQLRRLPETPTWEPGDTRVGSTTLWAGRRLTVDLCWLELLKTDVEGDGFRVRFGSYLLREQRGTLTLGGTNVGTLPLTVTNIEVYVTNRTLAVIGNGAPVLTKKLVR